MADGILAEVDHLITNVVRDMFGAPAGGGPQGGAVDSVRWEGMTNGQLAAAVQQLNSGPGGSGIQQAADALATVAGNLQQIDTTLQTQLKAIGVNWQSQAAELAQEMTTASAAYSTDAGVAGGANAAAVNAQGDAFAAARNAVPHPSTLQGSTSNSFLDTAGALLTGHETDHAQEVAKTTQARQQTIDTMNTYTASSQTHLASHQPLAQPPTRTLTPQPVDTGVSQITSVSSYVPPAQGVPTGGGVGGGGGFGMPGTGAAGTPGLPGGVSTGTPVGLPGGVAGGLPGTAGIPGQGALAPGLPGSAGLPGGGAGAPGSIGGPGGGGLPGGLPTGPGLPGGGSAGGGGGATPLGPGPVSGIGAPPAAASGGVSAAAQAASGAVGGSVIEDAAIGSAIVGGTVGAGVGGASARSDELVRSRQFGEPADEGDARSAAARALAELEGDEAAEAGVSARLGGVAEQPGPMLLEPAVGARSDDDEHTNRFGDSADMFDDGRMVTPPVLGADADPGPDEPK